MQKNNRILTVGQKEIKAGTRAWITSEFRSRITKLKETSPNLFIYSGLSQGTEISCAKEAIDLGVPVLGCIPHDNYTHDFSDYDMQLFRYVVPKLYFFKVADRQPTYESYRRRTLYLVHQSNALICFWDKKEPYTGTYIPLFLKQWKGKGYEIFHYNPEQKTSISSVS